MSVAAVDVLVAFSSAAAASDAASDAAVIVEVARHVSSRQCHKLFY